MISLQMHDQVKSQVTVTRDFLRVYYLSCLCPIFVEQNPEIRRMMQADPKYHSIKQELEEAISTHRGECGFSDDEDGRDCHFGLLRDLATEPNEEEPALQNYYAAVVGQMYTWGIYCNLDLKEASRFLSIALDHPDTDMRRQACGYFYLMSRNEAMLN